VEVLAWCAASSTSSADRNEPEELSGRLVHHRRPGRRDQGRDQDVRIEDGAHSAPSSTRLVLRLDGECERLLLVEVVALPEPVEQIEAELAPQRLFDHLAVALAGARTSKLGRLRGGCDRLSIQPWLKPNEAT
jgi:hypothetical protein